MEIRSNEPNPRRILQARVDEAAADALRRAREQNREGARLERPESGEVDRALRARLEAARRKEARIDNATADSRPAGERSGLDRVQLSSGARAVLETRGPAAERGATDPTHMAKFRDLIAEGGLFTPERIEQAARRLLSGDV